mmetsp:Transcript_33855/g.97342  ORF Transcript_33855/g.97342 Transcript_33855/m.97342 type:complete len:250 (+) Transcript_33855:54-803(+)
MPSQQPMTINTAHAMTPGARRGRFYKTKVCSYFARGNCTRGQWCYYAHGPEELRSRRRRPRMARHAEPESTDYDLHFLYVDPGLYLDLGSLTQAALTQQAGLTQQVLHEGLALREAVERLSQDLEECRSIMSRTSAIASDPLEPGSSIPTSFLEGHFLRLQDAVVHAQMQVQMLHAAFMAVPGSCWTTEAGNDSDLDYVDDEGDCADEWSDGDMPPASDLDFEDELCEPQEKEVGWLDGVDFIDTPRSY